MENAKAERALKWITSILESRQIPFRITGGLAAQVYGADRPLADIDLDVPGERLPELGPVLREFIKFGPARFKDDSWDLELLTVCYGGQEIDLGATQARIFDRGRHCWVDLISDVKSSILHEVLGLRLPVMPRAELIAYKNILDREVDRIDIEAILCS